MPHCGESLGVTTLCSGYNYVSADMIAESLMENGGEGFVEGVK